MGSSAMKSSEIVSSLVVLRALTGFLGEKQQSGWWDVNFLNRTGLEFMKINFPRSAFGAGVTSSAEAAKKLHDERIGKGGVYHLFRLPAAVEESVHSELFKTDPSSVLSGMESKDTALARLETMFEAKEKAPRGPVWIGARDDIVTAASVRKLAALYFDAFSGNRECFPYFANQNDRKS